MYFDDLFVATQDKKLVNKRAASAISRDFGGYCRHHQLTFEIKASEVASFNEIKTFDNLWVVSVSRLNQSLPYFDSEVQYVDFNFSAPQRAMDYLKGVLTKQSAETVAIKRVYESFIRDNKLNDAKSSDARYFYAPIQKVNTKPPYANCVFVSHPYPHSTLDSSYLGFAYIRLSNSEYKAYKGGQYPDLFDREQIAQALLKDNIHLYSAWQAQELLDFTFYQKDTPIATKRLVPAHSTTVRPTQGYLGQLQAMQSLVREYRDNTERYLHDAGVSFDDFGLSKTELNERPLVASGL